MDSTINKNSALSHCAISARDTKLHRRIAGAVLALSLIGSMLCVPQIAKADELDIDFLLYGSHTSDLFRTFDDGEPTHDFLGLGMTLTYGNFQIDLMQGIQSYDCGAFRGLECNLESGTKLAFRWYPFKGK